jgi:hypothetical protein
MNVLPRLSFFALTGVSFLNPLLTPAALDRYLSYTLSTVAFSTEPHNETLTGCHLWMNGRIDQRPPLIVFSDCPLRFPRCDNIETETAYSLNFVYRRMGWFFDESFDG